MHLLDLLVAKVSILHATSNVLSRALANNCSRNNILFHCLLRYIFFLLLLAISLGKLLKDKGISHEDICTRDYLPLTRTDDIWSTLGESTEHINGA